MGTALLFPTSPSTPAYSNSAFDLSPPPVVFSVKAGEAGNRVDVPDFNDPSIFFFELL
jgi:hypothetical protein